MKYLRFFLLFLVVGVTSASPTTNESEDNEKFVITKDFFKKSFVAYTSSHDIVEIVVPSNSFNFENSDDIEADELDNKTVIFFIEADIDAAGNKDYKGLYILKNGEATKLLENGRAIAANSDDSTDVFFGATDGIYVYDNENNKAVKYGSVTDNVIDMIKENSNNVIYYLNADHEIYKVSENGESREKMDYWVGARRIVTDPLNNLYYYDENKTAYVVNDLGVHKIQGLPENPSYVNLIKPPFVLEDGAILLVDNEIYIIYGNGTSEITGVEIKSNAKPTAYAMEAGVIQYYAYRKNIYRYNILSLFFGEFDEFKKFFDDDDLFYKSDSLNKLNRKHKEEN